MLRVTRFTSITAHPNQQNSNSNPLFSTPIGHDLSYFGVCDMRFYEEPDCQGRVVADTLHVSYIGVLVRNE